MKIILKKFLFSPFFDYLLICILGLSIFFTWFKGDLFYFGGDMTYPLIPDLSISRLLYTWGEGNAGNMESGMLYYFHWMFFFIGQKLGISVPLIEHCFLYLNFILPGLGMYYLTSIIFPKICEKYEIQRLACWIAALFYMVCPALLNMPQVYWFYGVFPFMLAFFINTLLKPDLKDKIFYSILAAFFCFGFIMFFPNGQMTVVFLLTIGIFSLWALFFYEIALKEIIKSWLIFGLIIILLNLGFVIPFLITISSQGGQMLASTPISFSQNTWLEEGSNAMTGNLVLTYRLGPEGGRSGFYYSPGFFLYLVNFFLAIFAFSAVILLRKSKMVLFFALTALCGIFIVQGPNIPFGEIYKWFVSNILVLRIFRGTGWVNALVALSYAILIASAFSVLYYKITRYCDKIGEKSLVTPIQRGFFIFLIFLILMNGWPMVTGAHYNNPSNWPNNVMLQIPQDYYDLDSWIVNHNNPQNIRLLALPKIDGYQSVSWSNHWVISPVIPYISQTPVIYSTAGREGVYSPLINPIFNASVTNPKLMTKLAGVSNVHYFYFDNYDANAKELNRTYFDTKDPTNSFYTFEKSIGNLDLYRINENFTLPRVYGSSNIKTIEGSINPDFVDYLNNTTPDFRDKPVFFINKQLTQDQWNFVNGLQLQISDLEVQYQQQNPTHYEITSDSRSPYILILSTQYSPYWRATINGKEVETHLIANGYANAWYIDQTGPCKISIDYKIQQYYYIALLVSFLTLIICAGYLIINYVKKRSPKQDTQI